MGSLVVAISTPEPVPDPGAASTTLGVIADYGDVGFGHLARSLAVIQEWRARGGAARLHTAGALPDGWARRLADEGVSIVPLDVAQAKADAWLLDGYRLDPNLQSKVRNRGVVAVVDDHGIVGRYDADLIIDQNLGASAQDYRARTDGAELLLGPRFALLRREIVRARPSAPPDRREQPRRLLVALGGQPPADLRDLVEPVIHEAMAWGLEADRLEGITNVSGPLGAATLALSAAGSTSWELCAFGIPAVIVAAAPNQRRIARQLGRVGAAVDGGDLGTTSSEILVAALRSLVDDPSTRMTQCRVGRGLVDGAGARRVVDALLRRVDHT